MKVAHLRLLLEGVPEDTEIDFVLQDAPYCGGYSPIGYATFNSWGSGDPVVQQLRYVPDEKIRFSKTYVSIGGIPQPVKPIVLLNVYPKEPIDE